MDRKHARAYTDRITRARDHMGVSVCLCVCVSMCVYVRLCVYSGVRVRVCVKADLIALVRDHIFANAAVLLLIQDDFCKLPPPRALLLVLHLVRAQHCHAAVLLVLSKHRRDALPTLPLCRFEPRMVHLLADLRPPPRLRCRRAHRRGVRVRRPAASRGGGAHCGTHGLASALRVKLAARRRRRLSCALTLPRHREPLALRIKIGPPRVWAGIAVRRPAGAGLDTFRNVRRLVRSSDRGARSVRGVAVAAPRAIATGAPAPDADVDDTHGA